MSKKTPSNPNKSVHVKLAALPETEPLIDDKSERSEENDNDKNKEKKAKKPALHAQQYHVWGKQTKKPPKRTDKDDDD